MFGFCFVRLSTYLSSMCEGHQDCRNLIEGRVSIWTPNLYNNMDNIETSFAVHYPARLGDHR